MSLTQTDFAKLVGVSIQAIRKGLKSGRIALNAEGRLDESMAERWHGSRDPSKVRAGKAGGRPPKGGVSAKRETIDASQEALGSFDELKTKKLAVDLEIAREELKRVRADTVNRDEIRRALTAFARLIRDKWVNFPNRYGQEIAATIGCEPKALMAELDKAVRLQLDEIANVKPTLPE